MAKPEHPQVGTISCLLALGGIWGYNWVVMKVGVAYSSPFDFAALRAFFGALSLFLVMICLRRPIMPKEVPATILLGALQTTAVLCFSMWALVRGGAGKTAILNYTMPFWLLLFAWIGLGERVRGLQWLSTALTLIGLVFILTPFSLASDLKSESLAVLSGISWALAAIVAKKLNQRTSLDVLSLAAWQMLFGSIPLIFIALVVPSPPIGWSLPFIAALAYNVTVATALAWVLWFYALSKLSAGTAGLGTLIIPVIGILAAWVQLGERPGANEAVGVVLILTALGLNVFHAMKASKAFSN